MQVLVSTVGRAATLIDTNSLDLAKAETVVLDEVGRSDGDVVEGGRLRGVVGWKQTQ